MPRIDLLKFINQKNLLKFILSLPFIYAYGSIFKDIWNPNKTLGIPLLFIYVVITIIILVAPRDGTKEKDIPFLAISFFFNTTITLPFLFNLNNKLLLIFMFASSCQFYVIGYKHLIKKFNIKTTYNIRRSIIIANIFSRIIIIAYLMAYIASDWNYLKIPLDLFAVLLALAGIYQTVLDTTVSALLSYEPSAYKVKIEDPAGSGNIKEVFVVVEKK